MKWQSSGCSECGGCGEAGQIEVFRHLECKGVDDWVSACRNVVVAGVRCVGKGRKEDLESVLKTT